MNYDKKLSKFNGFLIVSLSILLCIAQLFLILDGVTYFGKYFNPVLLLIVNVSFVFIYFHSLLVNATKINEHITEKNKRFILAIFGIISTVIIVFLFNVLFVKVKNPVDISDVIPQLEIQFTRFKNGEFPYESIVLPHSKPFPVYMPFHWLPIYVTNVFNVDSRWSGVILLLIAFAIFFYKISNLLLPFIIQLSLFCLLSVILICFILYGDNDLAVSLETTIASFYLILAIGFLSSNNRIILIGIVFCILSRYTLLFWLPLYLIVLNKEYGLSKSIKLCTAILLSVLIFYIIPFLAKDPSIFLAGLRYHNDAAAFEWEHGAWSFESGIYFAPHINSIIEATFKEKVAFTRLIQASSVIVVLAMGYFFYSKNRKIVNSTYFLLGMLFSVLVIFYQFSPLTYRYYLITPLLLSVCLCTIIAKQYFSTNKLGSI